MDSCITLSSIVTERNITQQKQVKISKGNKFLSSISLYIVFHSMRLKFRLFINKFKLILIFSAGGSLRYGLNK